MSSASTLLQIGLLGAGNIGSALARHFHRLGHDVLLSNSRGPETLRELAAEIGVKAVTAAEAAKAKDIIVISVPMVFTPRLAPLFADVSPDVIVIDTNNYYPELRDGNIPELDQTLVDSVWTVKQIGRPVVKVFNNLSFWSLADKARPKGSAGRMALPVAGEPLAHKLRVMELVDAIGFDPVDGGDIADSWRQGPGTPAYSRDYDVVRLKEALAAAQRDQIEQYRHQTRTSSRTTRRWRRHSERQ